MTRRWRRTSDDVELIEACRERDEAAWRVLVARYENLVYSTALRVGLDEEGAAEVHQKVWLELYRSLHRLRNPKGLPQWLIVTSRRLAFEHATREGRFVTSLREELLDPEPSADAEVMALQERQVLERALSGLGRRCRSLLEWLFLERPRPSYEEIGRRLDVAVGSIGSMRARCLARLGELVEEEQ